MNKKLNIAVIGCGYWGKNLIRNFNRLGALYAVSDKSKKLGNFYANQYKIKNLNIQEIIKDNSIQGVVIATPPKSHFQLLKKLLPTNKFLFVEKPMLSNLREVKILKVKYKKFLNKIFVGHLLQYHPIIKKIKKIIKNDKILNIYSERKNFGKIRSHENVIWSFAPHDISIVLSLIGKKIKKVSYSKIFIKNKNICDKADINLNFENNVNVKICLSWLEPKKSHQLIITTKNYFLVFNDTLEWPNKLIKYNYKISKSLKFYKIKSKNLKVKYFEPLNLECKSFLDMISKNKKPFTNFNEASKVIEVLEKTNETN